MELSLDLNKRYTIKDYLSWTDDVRRELIDGFIKLFPAPTTIHADIGGNVFYVLKPFDRKNNLRVFVAPADVFFCKVGDNKEEKDTVVQPDIFICKEEQVAAEGVYGAPLLIIEILSNYNKKKDKIDKYLLYEKHKVGEYLIVNPKTKTCEYYFHNGEVYDEGIDFTIEDEVELKCLGGVKVRLKDFF